MMTPKQFVKLFEKHGSLKAVFRATRIPGKMNCAQPGMPSYEGLRKIYSQAVAEGLMDALSTGRKTKEHSNLVVKGQLKVKVAPVIEGKVKTKQAAIVESDFDRRGVARFLFTSAQNNTALFDKFWDNLLIFRKHLNAQLHVSQFAYVKQGFGASGDKNAWMRGEKPALVKDFWFDPRIVSYASNELLQVAPGLVWCGDENISPSDALPLSGLQVVTGRSSAIVPHTKIAMESVASAQDEPTKFLYTTGAVTMKNYIARKAGKKADFHHCYGALLVEVNKDGDWWCRQINADSDGTIYDRDPGNDMCVRVQDCKITTGHRAAGITWGDSHEEQIDEVVKKVQHSEGGVIDVLRPFHQFFHDSFDNYRRGHHEIKSGLSRLERFAQKRECVKTELMNNGTFLGWASRPWCVNVDVDSNHNRGIGIWLDSADATLDSVNYVFHSELKAAVGRTVMETGDRGSPYITAMKLTNPPSLFKKVRFLREDENYIICHDHGGGIECGMHGDRGANGSRGSIKQFARFGRKANIGHSHSAGICDGIYQAGCSEKMYPAYVHGPSSWSHSFIVTYPNGKRAIYTIWKGQWHA